ncbi:ABC transporter permease [uncultured Parabacteroides sp.]|uniref:ABC transporter permease n=1 Tax=uncultured Parabacteroides sp. TaxID=512312 RepID=UPI0025DFD016|nr:ABC transporter permease [uncultured Parabacteroides sp.]
MKILLLAIRSLSRFRMYTAINILGLAMSLACVIILCRYIHREVTTDHFIKDLDRVYYTVLDRNSDKQPFIAGRSDDSSIPDPLTEASVEISSSFIPMDQDRIAYDDKKFNVRLLAVDSNYLKIMTYPILRSNHNSLFSQPDEAVLTKEFARKVFGDTDPIGQTFIHTSGNIATVTGILDEPDTQVSYPFDLLVSVGLQKDWMRLNALLVRLKPHTDVEAFNKRFDHYTEARSWGSSIRLQLYPLKKFYFDKQMRCYYNACQKGEYSHIVVLSIVALLLLIVGVFNFVNIYTVLMLKRAREFGMKKVFGANSKQVAIQLYLENLFMTTIALFGAWIFIELSTEIVQGILGIPIVPNTSFNIALSTGILFLLPVVTSVYPFIRYNYSAPITSLRSINRSGGSTVSRSIFLGIQYVITIVLVVVSIFFIKQLDFMLNTDLGFRTDHILKTQLLHQPNSDKEREEAYRKAELFEQQISTSPLFEPYVFGETPYSHTDYTYPIKAPGGEYKDVICQSISEKYFKLFDIKLKEGRLWDDAVDSPTEYNVIINETAQKLFNIKNLDNAEIEAERAFYISNMEDFNTSKRYKVVGIIKDFNTGHLSKATQPIVYYYYKNDPRDPFMAYIPAGKEQEAISFLKKLHEEVEGGEFKYSFISDEINDLYSKDKQITSIYSVFAIIAILISSLGLFGLSLFDVQQRYNEIAIRKVNGATTTNVMQMLLRKYYKLLIVAFLIAAPVSWIAINKYLEDFANKTSVSWWIFILALFITAGISLATLIWQIHKAAQTDPAKAMKTE